MATAALIFTVIATLVLGPVGYLWNGMAEELKKKADYETVIKMLETQEKVAAQKEKARLEREAAQKEKDDRQWKAIEQIIQAPKGFKVKTEQPEAVREKKYITKEILEFYDSLPDAEKIKFRKLHPAYQALPPPE